MIEKHTPEFNHTEVEQELALLEIQKKHMAKILYTPGLLDRTQANIKKHTPKWTVKGDSKTVVSRSLVGSRQEDGSWEDRENLQIGIETPNKMGSVVLFATVGKRVETSDGESVITPFEGFSEEDAQLVAHCLDELELAQLSGEIPDLSLDRSRVYIPQPSDRYLD